MNSYLLKKFSCRKIASGKYLYVWGLILAVSSTIFFLLGKAASRDFSAYAEYFTCLPTDSCDVIWEVEPSAILIAKLLGPFVGADVIIFLYIFLAFFLKLICFERSNNPVFVTSTYILIFSILLEVTQIRAAVGIGFSTLAIQSYLDGQMRRTVLLALLGVFFHYSVIALIALLVPAGILIWICVIGLSLFNYFFGIIPDIVASNPDIAGVFRLNSFIAYFNNEELPTIFNSRHMLSLLLVAPVMLRWIPKKIQPIAIRSSICMFAAIAGKFFVAEGVFVRFFDVFSVITMIFVIGYIRPHYIYFYMIFVLSIISFVGSLKIIGLDLL